MGRCLNLLDKPAEPACEDEPLPAGREWFEDGDRQRPVKSQRNIFLMRVGELPVLVVRRFS